MKPPLVSIIIPTYNMKSFLPLTIQNCCEQVYQNIEIVIADDGSSDGTEEFLQEFTSCRPIIYCKQENSGGAGSPRNLGLKHASGKYVQFLDADDLLDKEMTKDLVEILEDESVHGQDVVAYCDWRFYRTSTNGEVILERRGPPHGEYWPQSFSKQFEIYTVVHRFLYPRAVLDKYGYFDESMKQTEDLDLWTRLLIFGVKFLYCDKPMAFYRERLGHSMSNPIPHMLGRLHALENAKKYMRQMGIYEKYHDEVSALEAQWKENIEKSLGAQGI